MIHKTSVTTFEGGTLNKSFQKVIEENGKHPQLPGKQQNSLRRKEPPEEEEDFKSKIGEKGEGATIYLRVFNHRKRGGILKQLLRYNPSREIPTSQHMIEQIP